MVAGNPLPEISQNRSLMFSIFEQSAAATKTPARFSQLQIIFLNRPNSICRSKTACAREAEPIP